MEAGSKFLAVLGYLFILPIAIYLVEIAKTQEFWLELPEPVKDFMEAGKGRLRGDTREPTSNEVQDLRQENERLKLLVVGPEPRESDAEKSQY